MYEAEDLIWVKNVKREHGNGWAYMDVKVGDTFYLNWPEKKKGNVLKAKNGELILLFQTINPGLGQPKGTYLTHIITPLEDKIITLESTHPYGRLVACIAKGEIPKPSDLNFFKPNRGAVCRIDLIERSDKKPIAKNHLQHGLWDLFTHTGELKSVFEFVLNDQTDIEIEGVYEGEEKVKMKEHKYYERDPTILKAKKNEAKKTNRLFCEICGFNFLNKYGQHGEDFIECHHKYPIAKGGIRFTELKDLALVCSNCHRMLHRKNIEGAYYSTDELKAILI